MTGKRNSSGSDLRKVDAHTITSEEYDEIPELTKDWFERAELHVGGKKAPRGRPRSAKPKQPVKLRLDQDVITAFKAGGPGWQTRINEMLVAALAEGLKPHKVASGAKRVGGVKLRTVKKRSSRKSVAGMRSTGRKRA